MYHIQFQNLRRKVVLGGEGQKYMTPSVARSGSDALLQCRDGRLIGLQARKDGDAKSQRKTSGNFWRWVFQTWSNRNFRLEVRYCWKI